MLDFSFKAGYYEWNLFYNNDFVYSFGDVTDLFDDYSKQSITNAASDMVDAMFETAKNDYELNFDFSLDMRKLINGLSPEKAIELKELITNTLVRYYSD